MAKKFIGIDIENGTLRAVTAEMTKSGVVLTAAAEKTLATDENALAQALSEVLGDLAFGDKVAACLPAVGSFFRNLEFPFSDAKKINAALPLEMAGQVPDGVDLEFDFLAPRAHGNQFTIPAAAVKKSAVISLTEQFQAAGCTLHLLDLAPFAFAAGLRGTLDSTVLVTLRHKEIVLARVEDGQVSDYRSLPRKAGMDALKTTAILNREYLALTHAGKRDALPLTLIGSGVDTDLQQALRHAGLKVVVPSLQVSGTPLEPAFIPAAALALRAALPERERQLNFLKGELAPKSEWAGFRRRLIGASVMLGCCLILLGVGAYTNYAHKVARAEALREEMANIFRETFPQATVIVDVPAQMRSSLSQLQERARLLGLGTDRSALSILREVSARTPADVTLDVRELSFIGDQLRLDGTTSSFEAINRLSRSLESSSLFRDAQITDAKMGLDGTRVDFRLNLRIAPEDLIR
ncbi:type II secretion system protein GspL [Geoalkalibacter halelectricus]|uniref:type II secretion system protein GspL n=1 Tax=Geoalkalibacter halelectricus TaxID=2847045 RepID=UPI003D1B9A68